MMNRVLLSLLSLCLLAIPVSPAFADQAAVNGILVQEQVVKLPADQVKWHVSIVGNANDVAYQRTLNWFETSASLKGLKAQVHFHLVTTGTAIYQERYAGNVKGLPTVRVQKSGGEVVYEAAGENLPITAEGLYSAVVYSVQGRPVLPWRRGMEKRCPGPRPEPEPQPQPDPDPQPIDDGGTPVVEPQAGLEWALALVCIGGLLVGLCSGYGRQLYGKLHPVK